MMIIQLPFKSNFTLGLKWITFQNYSKIPTIQMFKKFQNAGLGNFEN